MTPSISLLLPSRCRPKLVERLFLSIVDTTANLANIEIILHLDEDDLDSHYIDSKQFRLVKIIENQDSMGAYNHACLSKSLGRIIVLINDDLVFKTHGWDEKIIAMDGQFSDKIYLAYTNDLFKSGWCSFPILSRRTCNELIKPYPIEYKGAFIDTHLYDIFKRLQQKQHQRICYLADVVFEHLHYRAGKAPLDETYKKRGRFDDDEAFVQLSAIRQLSADRLAAIIEGKIVPPKIEFTKKVKYKPKTVIGAFTKLTRQFLLNRKIPLRWRFFLWYWFLGRYLAARGLLWPIVKI
jgi:hypothetical protein